MARPSVVKQISLYTAKRVTLGLPPVQVTERIRGSARVKRNARLSWDKPLCVMCEKEGKVSVVEEWDHIVPLSEGGADHETNLQGLCIPHHAEKTAREAATRGTGGYVGFQK
jgi:5-methylcytosine-specific restriction endonuclease McrA